MNVLNHLGIGLYSNIPAVLSEVVANAWDADATEVEVNIDVVRDEIVIKDNGIGMTKDDINNKYLMVGYDKRNAEPGKTLGGRAPMGRKGIGKLSVFSIADTIIVYTIKNGQPNGLMMKLDDIKKRIEGKEETNYYPISIDASTIDFTRGTKIILRNLKRNINKAESFLRTRLSRRFSIIGSKYDFRVWINSREVTSIDRNYYDQIQFLWYTGEKGRDALIKCKSLKKSLEVDSIVDTSMEEYVVSGWIGTVDMHERIDDQNNAIIIYAHDKLIQEDILKSFKEGGVYARYLIGEIDADFMDLDKEDDIVTSDRQRVKEDDPRYEKLMDYVWKILKKIQSQWTVWRNELGFEIAMTRPTVKKWYDKWQGDNKTYAKKLFGKIESLKIDDPDTKKELYKASLIAFETMALKNSLSILDNLEDSHDFELITKVFSGIDQIEAIHYYQIAKGRLEIIRQFQNILLPETKEKVLQQYIFDHLWLLHPSWERAASDYKIEQSVSREFANIDAKLTQEEKAGRIDIRYRTAAGKHIIIELKKYDRHVTATELFDQIRKYRDALEKCLKTQYPEEIRTIESICILGFPPEPRDKEVENNDMLKIINARYITYDTLVQQAIKSYEEYLDKERVVSELNEVLDKIDEEWSYTKLPSNAQSIASPKDLWSQT